jgi:putative tricarboxylic transport membrane protein
MRKLDYEAAPLVLAFVLGRLAEESFRQSLLLSRGSLTILLSRPIATAFLAAAAVVVLLPVIVPGLRMLRGPGEVEADPAEAVHAGRSHHAGQPRRRSDT